MGIIIIVLIIFIFIFAFNKIAKKICPVGEMTNQLKENYKKQGLNFIMIENVNYIGGYDDICASCDSHLELFDDRFILNVYSENKILNKKCVKFTDVKSISINSEEEITNAHPSLAKMLVFGIYSFAMKGKTEKNIKNYIVVDFDDNDKIKTLVMTSKDNEDLLLTFNVLLDNKPIIDENIPMTEWEVKNGIRVKELIYNNKKKELEQLI